MFTPFMFAPFMSKPVAAIAIVSSPDLAPLIVATIGGVGQSGCWCDKGAQRGRREDDGTKGHAEVSLGCSPEARPCVSSYDKG